MAFKKLYECEFCGKTKYFFPEQAIGAKCECETSIDLNNTWCEATKENEWYENPDNFPCIVIYEEKEIKLMRSYSETSKHRKEPCLLTSDGGVYHSLDKCRPATKEEVLSLLVK